MALEALTFGRQSYPSLAQGLVDGHIYLPITKIDRENRTVWGTAQIEEDEPDTQNDVVDYAASLDAFQNWEGNVREMHEDKAVGKAVHVLAEPEQRRILVGTYVSKGAEDTWQKLLEQILRGYSIGGQVLSDSFPIHKATGKRYHRIHKYRLDELSFVDSPASPKCRITAVIKRGSGLVVKADFTPEMGRLSVRKASNLLPRRAADLL